MLLLALACTPAPSDSAATESVDPTAAWILGEGPETVISGQAFVFGPAPELHFADATLSVMEAPELRAPVADDGTFSLTVPSGAPLSFVLEHPELAPIQSATIEIEPAGLADLGFQVPTSAVVELMARASEVVIDAEACQVVSTVSSAASPPYGGSAVGEPGAVVEVRPALPEGASGPVYFEYVSDALILHDPELDTTTVDGGVIFANLPTGEWTLHASKAGVSFTEPTARCRPGTIVNASPPHGVEAID